METDDKIDDKMTDAEVNIESVRGNNEDMEDDNESKLEETKQFVSLFSKAEKMNQKKVEHQQRQQQPLQSSSWRDLGNPDDDTDANNDGCENEIVWTGFASDVRIIGDFSNWTPISLSSQGGDDWQVTLKLSEGPHLIKFIVDEKFKLSEMMEKVIGPDQEVYNLVHAGTNNSQTYEIR